MKRYTKKVQDGLLQISSCMEVYAADKYDEGDRRNGDAVTAALAWISAQEIRLKRSAEKRKVPNVKFSSGVLDAEKNTAGSPSAGTDG